MQNYLKKNIKKIFILLVKSFNKTGANRIFKEFSKEKKILIFFKKKMIPEISELKLINKSLNFFNPDLFLAVGGGTVIDYAKISNLLFKNKNLEKNIKNNTLKLKKKFPLVVFPTTAGSGAEVTSNAVIYVNKKKYSVENKIVKPEKYFLVPELVHNAPFNLKAESGFDAISQSIESILSIKATNKSLIFAKRSLKISIETYIPFLKSSSIDISKKMQRAANISGKAINISKTIAPHAVSYPFTSHFNIKHGHAVALTLNDFLKFNYENMKHSNNPQKLFKKFKILFEATNTNNIYELVNLIEKLKFHAGLEDNFEKLNINIKKKYPIILNGVNSLRLKNNPINLSLNDVKQILLKN